MRCGERSTEIQAGQVYEAALENDQFLVYKFAQVECLR
jgi:hypothetical protein